MAELTPKGGLKLKDGRIIYLDTELTLADYLELNKDPLFNTSILSGFPSSSGGMGFDGGGGGGSGGPSTPGLNGAQGSQGPAYGPQGVQGAQGGEGFAGRSGWQGSQGPQGTQGQQGAQGFFGFQGNQGNQGFTQVGPQGVQGLGQFGLQGSQGWQGFEGTGVQGPQGAQGPQGWRGWQGPQGFQGNQGNQGRQGSQGSGTQGPQGFQAVVPSAFSNLNPERKITYVHASIANVSPGQAGTAESVSATGTQTTVLDGQDQYVNYSSPNGGWYFAYNNYFVSTLPILLIKMKTGPDAVDITDHLMWHGFMSWTYNNAYVGASGDDNAPSESIVAFRCGKAGIDVNWKAVTNNAVDALIVISDTGVPIVVDTKYNFVIDCRDSASIKFYINGSLVATHTTKIPTLGMGVLSRGWKTNGGSPPRNQRLSLQYMTRY